MQNKLHDNFSISKEVIWLNNAGVAPLPVEVHSRLIEYLQEYQTKFLTSKFFDYNRSLSKIKQIISELLHCNPQEVTVVHNTAEALNYIAKGFPFQSGDKVLLLEDEYPSTYYPWLTLQKQGVEVEFLPVLDHSENFLKKLETLLSQKKIRVAMFSARHWITGAPLPLDQIGELTGKYGVYLGIDGAQGVGNIDIDVVKSGVDFLTFSTWKWMMGPLGMCGFYMSDRFLEMVEPVFLGTGSFVNGEQYLPYKKEVKKDIDRYILSTISNTDLLHLLFSLEFLRKTGFQKVRETIRDLSSKLYTGLFSLGAKSALSPALYNGEKNGENQKSEPPDAIISVEFDGKSSNQISVKLAEKGIHTAVRNNYVRFSPHICNSEEDIDKTISFLSTII